MISTVNFKSSFAPRSVPSYVGLIRPCRARYGNRPVREDVPRPRKLNSHCRFCEMVVANREKRPSPPPSATAGEDKEALLCEESDGN